MTTSHLDRSIGTLPSRDDIDKRAVRGVLSYKTNYQLFQINLMGEGDILLLYTDGPSEHTPEEMTPTFRITSKARSEG